MKSWSHRTVKEFATCGLCNAILELGRCKVWMSDKDGCWQGFSTGRGGCSFKGEPLQWALTSSTDIQAGRWPGHDYCRATDVQINMKYYWHNILWTDYYSFLLRQVTGRSSKNCKNFEVEGGSSSNLSYLLWQWVENLHDRNDGNHADTSWYMEA